MWMRRWIVAVAAALVICASVGLRAADELYIIEKDVTYGKGADVELKLDIVRPREESKEARPIIVFIHGGGWVGGKRQDFTPFVMAAAQRGYVAATISYRLTKEKGADGKPKHIFPAQIHDCKAAIRWIRANAAKYGADPDRIGVAGASAGGHLALLVGLADKNDKLEGKGGHEEVSSRVQAVVNIFGVTEFETIYQKTDNGKGLVETFLGGKPEEVPQQYKAASPVTYITKDDPPVLTLHGAKDTLVPIQQAKILDHKMKAAGVRHEMIVFEEDGHGFGGVRMLKAMGDMFGFLDKELKKGKGGKVAEVGKGPQAGEGAGEVVKGKKE